MNPTARIVVVAVILAALGGGAALWLRQGRKAPPAPKVEAQRAAPSPARPAAPLANSAPPIRHLLGAVGGEPKEALPPLAEADAFIKKALIDLLGRKSVQSFLKVDDVLRRVVATVDNLAREHAAAQLWPVNPTTGPFIAERDASGRFHIIGASNSARYAAFVGFLEAIDTGALVALYKRVYPLLDEEYQDIGYPGQYFNDRVVDVIDELLATPDIVEPIKLKVIQVDATVTPPPSAALYLFEDSTLERRSAGQKLLLRVGRGNATRLKAKLADIRRQIATASGGPPPPIGAQ